MHNSKGIRNEDTDLLLDGILTLKDREEAYQFLEDLCTVGEITALAQRFQVAHMLREERTYQDISEATGASTATISRVNRAVSYGNDAYNMVLDRLEGKES